jgi:hypothetical protein
MPHNHFTLMSVMLGYAIGDLLFWHYHLFFERLKGVMAERQGFSLAQSSKPLCINDLIRFTR